MVTSGTGPSRSALSGIKTFGFFSTRTQPPLGSRLRWSDGLLLDHSFELAATLKLDDLGSLNLNLFASLGISSLPSGSLGYTEGAETH